MSSLRKYTSRRIQKPASTSVYDNNGIDMHKYKSMIDYMDAKLRTIEAHYAPETPWKRDRGLPKHTRSGSVDKYSDEHVEKLLKASTTARAERELLLSKLGIHSDYGHAKDEAATKTLEKFRRRQAELEHENEEIERVRILKYVRTKDKLDSRNEPHFSGDLKRDLRGRSPDTIAAILLVNADKNIRERKQQDKEYINQTIARTIRANKTSRRLYHDSELHADSWRIGFL